MERGTKILVAVVIAVVLGVSSNAAPAPFERVIFDAHTSSLEEFEMLVAGAAAAGVTHINISRPIHRTRYVDRDGSHRSFRQRTSQDSSIRRAAFASASRPRPSQCCAANSHACRARPPSPAAWAPRAANS